MSRAVRPPSCNRRHTFTPRQLHDECLARRVWSTYGQSAMYCVAPSGVHPILPYPATLADACMSRGRLGAPLAPVARRTYRAQARREQVPHGRVPEGCGLHSLARFDVNNVAGPANMKFVAVWLPSCNSGGPHMWIPGNQSWTRMRVLPLPPVPCGEPDTGLMANAVSQSLATSVLWSKCVAGEVLCDVNRPNL